jgi:hypothetical protein
MSTITDEKRAKTAAADAITWRSVLCHTHTYSGRDDHGGPVRPPESYQRLAAWARELGVDAIGMGSPYTPRSAVNHGRFDGDDRDIYYSDSFDPVSVLQTDEINAMLADAQRSAGDRTLFFLDNETPKGRFGHMWWVGYHYDLPPWHDYDQPFDRWMCEESTDDSDEPMPYERRPYLQILATQRAHGALGVWAHPTSWWRGERGQFITNIASEMPAHVMADSFLDGLVIMGYHPYRPQYLALWHELLDRGYRVTGVAEMDCGLSDPKLWASHTALLNHVEVNGEGFNPRSMVKSFRAGRVFASSGPSMDLRVDGARMGQTTTTSPDQAHLVEIEAHSKRPGEGLGRLELVGRGGEVVWSTNDFAGGTVRVRVAGLRGRGYLIARAFGQADANEPWRSVRQVAISNPVYLHPRGTGFEKPMQTRVTVRIHELSPFCGGQIRFEDMHGEALSKATVRAGAYSLPMPASGRVTLIMPDGFQRTDYLVNANRRLTDIQRYLYRGRFLRDYPTLQPGELPPAAWRLDDYAAALREVELMY